MTEPAHKFRLEERVWVLTHGGPVCPAGTYRALVTQLIDPIPPCNCGRPNCIAAVIGNEPEVLLGPWYQISVIDRHGETWLSHERYLRPRDDHDTPPAKVDWVRKLGLDQGVPIKLAVEFSSEHLDEPPA